MLLYNPAFQPSRRDFRDALLIKSQVASRKGFLWDSNHSVTCEGRGCFFFVGRAKGCVSENWDFFAEIVLEIEPYVSKVLFILDHIGSNMFPNILKTPRIWR